ncbi:PEP/pyruvate-binding domain-containing protein [Propionivibrio sp.]|uniref:PEP/pyruvate-binding domain-containing protein n=1 Tax=Propionivibrio sp. TaxID=2212460 RepID=UPI003BF2F0F7
MLKAPPPVAANVALPAEVYLIGCGSAVASAGQPSAQSMGFKAWNLLRMVQMSLPVPPAFVLGTHYCVAPSARQQASSSNLWSAGLHELERATGLALGDTGRPLLLSVRSGAPVSMPGMMDTILNIGLCDATVSGLLRQTGNPRLVWDAYRRLVATYGEVVAGLPGQLFSEATTSLFGMRDERELDFAELRELTRRFLDVYVQAAGRSFPQYPRLQLAGAIEAVFASWQSARACKYRRLNRISDEIGTAVTVQCMVFGNAGGQSGAGVGFTRDPTTGEPALWVDFLFNAQGEDVVSGRRSAYGHDELAAVLPSVWQALQEAARQLEQTFSDMQDFEFTVQEGQLFMLQTRDGKRTPYATARIALDLLDAGLIDADQARERTSRLDREALARPRIVGQSGTALVPLGRAITASSGVAVGEIALDETRAVTRHGAGVTVILVRRDAETSDIAALESASGLLTQRGARTSHASVVARQLGKVCLVGCSELSIDEVTRTIKMGDTMLHEGDLLTLDGNEGILYAGAVQTEIDYPDGLLARLESLRKRH